MSTEAAGKIAAQSVREAHQHPPRVVYTPIEKKTRGGPQKRRNTGQGGYERDLAAYYDTSGRPTNASTEPIHYSEGASKTYSPPC